jgi:hypothetical protein
MTLVEGFRAFARQPDGEAGVAVWQGQDEQRGLVAATGHIDNSPLRAGAAGARRPRLAIACNQPRQRGRCWHSRCSVAVLVAKAIEDASSGVTLFGRGVAILLLEGWKR